MTEKQRERKVKKAAYYSTKATMDFLNSKDMKEMLIDLYTGIYSDASEDVLGNIYDVIGTMKGYIKVSKIICEDKFNYYAIAKILEDNEPYIREQFSIDTDK